MLTTRAPAHFTGKERDAETGLDYFGARYFSAVQGRFTSADPKQYTKRHLASPQKWNKYAYVQNNPLASIDPDGLDDYKVFITANVANPGGWDQAKQVLESRGHTLQVFVGGEATLKRFTDARSDRNARVVFVGHSIGPDIDSARNGVKLGDDGVVVGNTAQQQPLGGIPGAPWDAGPAKANTVALFACQSADLASSYSGANFLGMSSGTDHVTDFLTLGKAAFSFVAADALARPADGAPPSTLIGPLDDPAASANAVVRASPFKIDEGDRVVQIPKEVKQQ
jgi:RHS repeat-associated protein